MPYITQVAIGRRDKVQRLRQRLSHPGRHRRARLHPCGRPGHRPCGGDEIRRGHSGLRSRINLGTGIGYSVLDMISAFSRAVGKEIPYTDRSRAVRATSPSAMPIPKLAYDLLGWKAVHTLDDMCADSWRWQQQNPYGYSDKEA